MGKGYVYFPYLLQHLPYQEQYARLEYSLFVLTVCDQYVTNTFSLTNPLLSEVYEQSSNQWSRAIPTKPHLFGVVYIAQIFGCSTTHPFFSS